MWTKIHYYFGVCKITDLKNNHRRVKALHNLKTMAIARKQFEDCNKFFDKNGQEWVLNIDCYPLLLLCNGTERLQIHSISEIFVKYLIWTDDKAKIHIINFEDCKLIEDEE